ncbi:MAG: response regulator, partial [Acidobacteriota bacterium]
LEKLNCSIEIATDGSEALQALRNGRFDLILMDCQMPRMDGFTATREIRKNESNGPFRSTIIAMTAQALEGAREECLSAGMDDYISKPVTMSDLRTVLERWAPRF